MQNQVPKNCPIDLPEAVLQQNPSLDTLFDVAVGVEAHNNAVNDTLMPFGEHLSIDVTNRAVGHTACASCTLIEQCRKSVAAAEEIAAEIRHPLDFMEELDAKSIIDLWSASIVTQAEHGGYTRESSANMVGRIAQVAPPLRTMIIKVLESDTTRIPIQIGKVKLGDKSFDFVDFGDVRLMISDTALRSLTGNGNYLDGFVTNVTDALLRTGTSGEGGGTKATNLRHALETNNFKGLGIKPLIDMPHVREFNGGAHGTLRGFGTVIGRTPEQPGSQDTIVIAHIADAKGGADGTKRESSKVEKLVNKLSAETIRASIEAARADKTIASLQKKLRVNSATR